MDAVCRISYLNVLDRDEMTEAMMAYATVEASFCFLLLFVLLAWVVHTAQLTLLTQLAGAQAR